MPNTLPTLYCPNLKCRAQNTELDPFCQQCGTAIPKRYLWVIGGTGKPDETMADRYTFRGPRVVIDTQPGLPLKLTTDLPNSLIPYLKLFPYRLHLPQLYTAVPSKRKRMAPIILLEQAPLGTADFFEADQATQMDLGMVTGLSLLEAWGYAHPLRQVNWLWQMAQLWQPLMSQGVASSLLQPELLRVEERLLRLLELQPDFEAAPTLAELGELWLQWLPATAETLVPDFEKLCQDLIQGAIATPELLLDNLEQLLVRYQDPYQLKIDISARTDSGPVRDHNEDSCYPNHGVIEQNSLERLAIVCDGVGGHDGGEVASGIAIEAMTSHLTRLQQGALPTDVVIAELEAATFQANDLISQRNDDEQRQDRQRMGTTLVTTLIHNQQAYLTHIGDSRAYLITASGCYQLTLDDDIASREVRLGYVPYREALQQPASGSLTQALGMASSAVLRPTVQRLILDEDCVLLLCSDGLSDYDRVEMLWRTEVLPLLHQETDLVTVTKHLIDQANQLNGHDNVTVAILHCRVTRPRTAGTDGSPRRTLLQNPKTTQPLPPPTSTSGRRASSPWKLWSIAGLLVALVAAGLAYLFARPRSQPPIADPSVSPSPAAPTAIRFSDLAPQMLLEVRPASTPELDSVPVRLWEQSQPPTGDDQEGGRQVLLPAGRIVRVQSVRSTLPETEANPAVEADEWIQIQVCPNASSTAQPPQGAEPTPETDTPNPEQPATPDAQLEDAPDEQVQIVGWVPAADLLPQAVIKPVDSVFDGPVCGRSTEGAGEPPSGDAAL